MAIVQTNAAVIRLIQPKNMKLQVRDTFCVLVLFSTCLFPVTVKANKYIIHSKTILSTCLIDEKTVMSEDVQLDICRQWTHEKPIVNWNMSAWAVLSDPSDPELLSNKLRILPGQVVYFSRISYLTSVKLPTILEKITNIHLSIAVSKKLFIYNKKVYSFVQIRNVPIVGYLTISNVASMIDSTKVLSQHMISHGDIPWFASWAVDILKNEILKSVDTYDMTCVKVYCAAP